MPLAITSLSKPSLLCPCSPPSSAQHLAGQRRRNPELQTVSVRALAANVLYCVPLFQLCFDSFARVAGVSRGAAHNGVSIEPEWACLPVSCGPSNEQRCHVSPKCSLEVYVHAAMFTSGCTERVAPFYICIRLLTARTHNTQIHCSTKTESFDFTDAPPTIGTFRFVGARCVPLCVWFGSLCVLHLLVARLAFPSWHP